LRLFVAVYPLLGDIAVSIYLDNNSSTFPKPKEVRKAVEEYLNEYCTVPNEFGNSLSKKVNGHIQSARESVAKLIGASSDEIYFANNSQNALMKILELLTISGDRIITSEGDSLLHHDIANMQSVRGVEHARAPFDSNLGVKAASIKKVVGSTKVVALSAMNAITGAILPIDEIARNCSQAGAVSVFDLSDIIGYYPIDVKVLDVDVVYFDTHKHLFGLPGLACVYVNKRVLDKLKKEVTDDLFTLGEKNIAAIVALSAGCSFVLRENVERIINHIRTLRNVLQGVLEMCNSIDIIAPNTKNSGSVLSFTVRNHMPNTLVGLLEERFGLLIGHGLLGNPGTCRAVGAFPNGVLRVSMGLFNAMSDVEYLGTSIERLLSEVGKRR